MSPRVAIAGAGVSGLTVALRLTDAGLGVVVLESGARTGGKVASADVGGFPVPSGPDSFPARKPWAASLCRELGVELVEPASSGTWLWTSGGLVRYPAGTAFGIPGDVGDVIRWPGLSRRGRRRALMDLFRAKRKGGEDETLGSLLRRRLGDEATDRALAPLLAGLFAGDVDRLSVRATFPELERWEDSQGSLIRGAQAAMRDARKADLGPMFLAPRAGIEEMTDVLASKLGQVVRTGASVRRVERRGEAWLVRLDDGEGVEVDAVVLATGAASAAELVRDAAPGAAGSISRIREVSTAVVLMVYSEGSSAGLPDGTGFVVPRGAAPMTACSWHHQKWPRPEYGDRAVLRCFVGAAGDEDVLEAGDREIVEACSAHLAAVLPLPDRPEHAVVVRWPRSMPQYELGHLELVERIRSELPPGIFVTGQPYEGAGIPDCVKGAGRVAEEVSGYLRAGAAGSIEGWGEGT